MHLINRVNLIGVEEIPGKAEELLIKCDDLGHNLMGILYLRPRYNPPPGVLDFYPSQSLIITNTPKTSKGKITLKTLLTNKFHYFTRILPVN